MSDDVHAFEVPMYQVDAFTDQPFRGNPAAVCLMDRELDDATMQSVAAENNLSETAFVRPMEGGTFEDGDEFHLRWFTPEVEVPLCGHATLATASVLFDAIGYLGDEIRFRSLSGPLVARRDPGGILLDFPVDRAEPIEPPVALLKALGVEDVIDVRFTGRGRDILVRVQTEIEVREIRPDFRAVVESTEGTDINGAIVTAEGGPPYDFVSRFFAPWWGIDEDPVTGAAHTILAPYWSEMLGKARMRAFQASRRGGDLIVELEGDRVHLIGRSVIVLRGTMFIG